MRVTAKQYEVEHLREEGLYLSYVLANIQPFIGFMSAFTSVKTDTTLQEIFDFAKGREDEAIDYIEQWFVKIK